MVFEQLAGVNLVNGNIFFGILTTIFNLSMVVLLMAFFGAILWWLFKVLSYNIEIEIWEKTGENALSYWGDDRGSKNVVKGVAYLSFLKNKTEPFRRVSFPDSNFIIKKRIFGTKIKMILNGVDLFPASKFIVSDGAKIEATSLPNYVKRDHLQRLELLHEDFNKKPDKIQMATLVIGFGLVTVVLFGFFVIWQSNVETAEATRALASSLVSIGSSASNALPSSPT